MSSGGVSDTPALHDQLLRAIELDDEDNHGGFRCQSIDALRAVVELHAPVQPPELVLECDHDLEDYPCPTIRAVASALGVELP